MNNTPEHDEIPRVDDCVDDYTPLLLAFGPADHEFETEGSDDAGAYIVGYN
ncbi:MAG: hypothetical protein P8Y69_16520 [Gammaproteobacteria bacterium]|jgi:hypothetical protein